MKKNICACIITYNIDKKINEVVNSIINQVDLVVIVDNASKSDTLEILKKLNENDKVDVIFNKINNGIAIALNQGIKVAKNKNMEWIMTLDHDSICDENMIKNMFEVNDRYHNEDKIAILAPQIFEMHKQDFISNKNNNNYYTEVNECIQSGSLFKISIFDKIGYFNEDLFIYHVDYDFCERVLRSGYKIIQCNNTILYHEEGYKIQKKFLGIKTYYNNYSSFAIYYITRNTIYMSQKYSIFYLKRIVKDYIYITLYDKQRKERLAYWKRGVIDGILKKYGKLEV